MVLPNCRKCWEIQSEYPEEGWLGGQLVSSTIIIFLLSRHIPTQKLFHNTSTSTVKAPTCSCWPWFDAVCVNIHTQSCPILWGPMHCSLLGSSVHGISQARILERVAISSFTSSRESSWPRNRTCVSRVSCIGRQILYHWVTWEAPQFDSSLILNPTLAPLNTCTCFSQTSNLHT